MQQVKGTPTQGTGGRTSAPSGATKRSRAARWRAHEAERRYQQELERAAAQSPTEWWRVLEVAPTATKEETVRNYRRKIQQCHPDRVTGLAPEFLELAEEHSKALKVRHEFAARSLDLCRYRDGAQRRMRK